ncbi:tetratricopeptide repeat protein [candidate division KSB1 bacterium]|nr:tetratricopeptide repeat protein [candidate division KSB1 bacterium]
MPEIITFFSIFLGLLLLILAFLYFKSESAVRARLRIVWLILLSVLILIIIFSRLPGYLPDDRLRLSVFPIADYSGHDSCAWIPYYITGASNTHLHEILSDEFRVYPQEWIWQCLDADSSMNVPYLQNLAARIELDYAVFGSLSRETTETAIEYLIFKSPERTLLHQGRVALPSSMQLQLGEKLARDIAGYWQYSVPLADSTGMSLDEQFLARRTLARKNLAQRNYAEAVQFAAQAFALDSTDVPARTLYAQALLLQGIRLRNQGQGSDDLLLRALRLCEETILNHRKDDATLYRLLAKYYIVEKMFGKAEECLLKAIALDPDDPHVYFDYTYLHPSRYKKIGFDDEEQILKHVLFLNPCYEEARLHLSDYHYYRNNTVKARAAVEALLAIHPRSVDGLMYLGNLAMEKKDSTEFTRIYDLLLDIAPHNPEVFYNLGIYYYHRDDFEQAEEYFNRAVRRGNHPDSHLYLGYIYEKMGRLRRAQNEYALRIRDQRGPDDPFAEEARRRLQLLTNSDSSIFHANEN